MMVDQKFNSFLVSILDSEEEGTPLGILCMCKGLAVADFLRGCS
jgi:hypothetical protein